MSEMKVLLYLKSARVVPANHFCDCLPEHSARAARMGTLWNVWFLHAAARQPLTPTHTRPDAQSSPGSPGSPCPPRRVFTVRQALSWVP